LYAVEALSSVRLAMGTTDDERDAYIELPPPEDVARSRPPNHPYNFGFVTSMSRLLMAHPRIGPAFMAMFGEIMFAPGALDRREREMVAAVAASAQYCHY
jgi:alkylhydroperoxidase family enzyme